MNKTPTSEYTPSENPDQSEDWQAIVLRNNRGDLLITVEAQTRLNLGYPGVARDNPIRKPGFSELSGSGSRGLPGLSEILRSNRDKSLVIGEKAHVELRKRLNSGEDRYPAIKAIAAKMCKPANEVRLYLANYCDHLKREKEASYRAQIIDGMKARKTDQEIAKEIGVHAKTVADRRRKIQSELLEAAV